MSSKKKAIGVWIRVSTEDQKKGESPKIHLERAKLYAELHGYEIKEVYDLSGISGKTVINTTQAQNMLYHIKQKHITGLIFSKIARFARNTRELLDFADYFKEHDANLISLGESFDSNSPSGRLFFTFISAIGQWEREELVSRVNSSIQTRGQMGKRLGGKVPYGYTWDGHELHIEPNESPIRKLVFELFIQEKRKKSVASILNQRGYRTRSGKKFYDSNVERWIRDPLSKGLRISNHTKKVIKNGKQVVEKKPKSEWFYHEAPSIVSDELWQKANDILNEIQSKRAKPLNKRTHVFTQFIYCECGSRMSVRSGNKFYRCTKSGCGNKIEREQFEIIYKEQLKSYVSSEENIKQYLSLSNSTAKDKQILFESQTERHQELKKKIDAIIQLYMDGQLPKERFKEYHDPLDKELTLVEKELNNLESEIKIISKQKDTISSVVKEATDLYNNWDNFDMNKKRRLVEMITERITIGKDDSIHIKLFRLMPNASFFELETNGQHNPWVTLPSHPFTIKTLQPKPKGYPKRVESLADAIKKKRYDLKLTKAELAKNLNASPITLALWEDSHRKPTPIMMKKIIEFLGYIPPLGVDKSTLGGKLYSFRMIHGFSQKEIGIQLKIDRWAITKIEQNVVGVDERYINKVRNLLSN